MCFLNQFNPFVCLHFSYYVLRCTVLPFLRVCFVCVVLRVLLSNWYVYYFGITRFGCVVLFFLYVFLDHLMFVCIFSCCVLRCACCSAVFARVFYLCCIAGVCVSLELVCMILFLGIKRFSCVVFVFLCVFPVEIFSCFALCCSSASFARVPVLCYFLLGSLELVPSSWNWHAGILLWCCTF